MFIIIKRDTVDHAYKKIMIEVELNTVVHRWEDAKRTYLKFINKIFMRHTERKSYTHTHTHPITHIHSL